MCSPYRRGHPIKLVVLLAGLSVGEAVAGPVSEVVTIANAHSKIDADGTEDLACSGRVRSAGNRLTVRGEQGPRGLAPTARSPRPDGGSVSAVLVQGRAVNGSWLRQQLLRHLESAAAARSLTARWPSTTGAVDTRLTAAANLSRPEAIELRGAAPGLVTSDLPDDEARFRHLLEPDQAATDWMLSSYYADLARRFAEPDWSQVMAIDLFGASELPADREADDDSPRPANSWSEERIVTGSLGDSDSDGSPMHGRLMAAFGQQQLPMGLYTVAAAKTTEVPVRGFLQRLIRWAYQNPILAGLIGGAATLLLTVAVSRNTVQGEGGDAA